MTMRERLVLLRTRHGWSQGTVARLAGIAQPTLQAYESGTRHPRGMSVDVALRLAQIYGISVEALASEPAVGPPADLAQDTGCRPASPRVLVCDTPYCESACVRACRKS